MIRADGVSRRAGGRALVDRVTLALAPGRMTVLVGPNGAGKSTLIGMMTGEVRPSAGRVEIHGRDIAGLTPRAIAMLRAVLPQATPVAFPFSVLDVVRMGAVARAARDPDGAALAALSRLGLAAFAGRSYPSLSGGEQQRVQFARVLAQMPAPAEDGLARALFLDEPVASLDLAHQIAVLDVARSFARGGGMVLAVLHDLNLAAEYADSLVFLKEGRIVAEGPPSESLTDAAIAAVYGVSGTVGRLPPPGTPFVLTQARDA
ncbi:heme ABC transporter ATP-binding protein [Ensifer soli]|uniref:heme ABC transporter ATP-binding protein n=1 Tax=Ciceribacter sp. sgz301302 TaxID=3342379 RepID=UPI0035B760AF